MTIQEQIENTKNEILLEKYQFVRDLPIAQYKGLERRSQSDEIQPSDFCSLDQFFIDLQAIRSKITDLGGTNPRVEKDSDTGITIVYQCLETDETYLKRLGFILREVQSKFATELQLYRNLREKYEGKTIVE